MAYKHRATQLISLDNIRVLLREYIRKSSAIGVLLDQYDQTQQLKSVCNPALSPIIVTSSVVCENLNADLLDGYQATDFLFAATAEHGNLLGLDDDDHTQYLTSARHQNQALHGPSSVDHGNIAGLTDDDHLQYARTDGTRNITGDQTFNQDIHVVGDLYVNDIIADGDVYYVHEITASGNINADGNLYVDGSGIVKDDFGVGGDFEAQGSAIVPTPTANQHATTKKYVDDFFDALNAPTGFPNRTDSSWSYTDGATPAFQITPVSSSYIYYIHGVKHTITTTKTVTFDGSPAKAEGLWHFYLDSSETLSATQTFSDSLILNDVWISSGYWDDTNNVWILKGEERHGIVMDGQTHITLHNSVGSVFKTGLALSELATSDSNTTVAPSSDRQNQFIVSSGAFFDEDILHSISDQGTAAPFSAATFPLFYRDGTTWRKQAASALATKGTAGNRIAYNAITGASGSQVEASSNFYCVLAHLFATNDPDQPIIAVQGQNEYSSKSLAREGAAEEIKTLYTVGLPFLEIIAIATLIYQTSDQAAWDTYSNVKLISSSDAAEDYYIDWRTASISSRNSSSVSDHGLLSGLTNDDHTGYARLAGRSGGQTLYGGTGASESLNIESTSNATKGIVALQPNGGNVTVGSGNIINDALTASRAVVTGGSKELASSATTSDEIAALNALTASRAVITDGSGLIDVSAATATEVGYLSGVTSAIQTQINAKKTIATGNAYKFETTDATGALQETTVTASRAVVTDANGLPAASATTATQVGYLSTLTSDAQTQINTKVTGPGSATDNAIVRFDLTTGKLVQDSGCFIDDSNNLGIGVSPGGIGEGGSPRVLQVHNTGSNAYGHLILSGDSTTNGELLGAINFGSTGSSTTKRSAAIYSYLEDTGTTNAVGGLRFSTNNAGTFDERMRITSGGNVGIGETSPGVRLVVSASDATSMVQLKNTTGATTWELQNSTDGNFHLNANGVGNDVINVVHAGSVANTLVLSGGNVGIGAAASSGLFEVTGSDPSVYFTDSDGAQLRFLMNGTAAYIQTQNNYPLYLTTNNGSVAITIDTSQRVGIGKTPTTTFDVAGKGLFTADSDTLSFAASTGTNETYIYGSNTGGGMIIGRESSAGAAIFTGSAAYAGVFGVNTAHSLQFATSGAVKMTIDSSGNIDIPGVYAETTASAPNVYVASDGSLQRSTASITSPGLTHVQTQSPSSASSVTFTGLTAGKKYKLIYYLLQNTSNGVHNFLFNNDTGNNYDYGGKEELSTSGGYGTPHGAGVAAIVLSSNGGGSVVTAGSEMFCEIDFQASPNDLTRARLVSMGSLDGEGASSMYSNRICGYYDGASDVTRVDIVPSAGTVTGKVSLYEYQEA